MYGRVDPFLCFIHVNNVQNTVSGFPVMSCWQTGFRNTGQPEKGMQIVNTFKALTCMCCYCYHKHDYLPCMSHHIFTWLACDATTCRSDFLCHLWCTKHSHISVPAACGATSHCFLEQIEVSSGWKPKFTQSQSYFGTHKNSINLYNMFIHVCQE